MTTSQAPDTSPAPAEGASGTDVVERVARAICQSKGLNPQTLFQHNFEGDYPEDERREYDDPFTGEPRVQMFHRAWRHSVPAARAAIAALAHPASDREARLVEALREAVVQMEYDYPGDVPEPCGMWCQLCKQHVDDDKIGGHASACLLVEMGEKL